MSGCCKNSTESGCRCPDHHPGLAAYARDRAAFDAALEPLRNLRPVRMRVVTMPGEILCQGTMTCPCASCTSDRVKRPAIGAGPAQFKVRPARARRAA